MSISIIAALREYLASCPALELLTGGIKTDWTDTAGDYGVMPSGEQPGERYMDGSRINRYNFTLYAQKFTEADLERLENAEFLERFARWIEDNEAAGIYPALGEGVEALGMSCANGMLFEFDESGRSGVYMIQLTMTYERSAG